MTTSFNELKRSSASDFDKLNKELTKINTPTNGADDRLWTCQTDKAGNGHAVIRFLPAPAGEDVPFIRLWSHGFKGSGGWYIENSLSTIGQPDPVGEMNTKLWNEGEGSRGRKTVTGSGKENPGSKRQLNYYSNIYVVRDPANPENEGKVFLFRYGKKIFDHLNDLMHPAEDPIDPVAPVNPFDFWAGANFKLKIRRVEGYANYDKSEFETPGPLAEDAELEGIWKKQFSLQEIVSPKKFKSYAQLQAQLNRALGNAPASTQSRDEDPEPEAPARESRRKEPAKQPKAASVADDDDDDDDDMAFFKKLSEEEQ